MQVVLVAGQKKSLLAPKHGVGLGMQCGSAGQIHCSAVALLFPRSTGACCTPGTQMQPGLPTAFCEERRHSFLAKIECLRVSFLGHSPTR